MLWRLGATVARSHFLSFWTSPAMSVRHPPLAGYRPFHTGRPRLSAWLVLPLLLLLLRRRMTGFGVAALQGRCESWWLFGTSRHRSGDLCYCFSWALRRW